jgi:hypothetical protein
MCSGSSVLEEKLAEESARRQHTKEMSLSDEPELQELHEVVPGQRPGHGTLGGGALPADFEVQLDAERYDTHQAITVISKRLRMF